ncbi:MAG: hypothetical protein AAF067_07860 [Pseudomonadota bacterium]
MSETPVRFYKRPLFILLSTLAIGMLIGAAVTGAIVNNRVKMIRSLGQAEGFTTVMTDIISPVSDEQAERISPIIATAGRDIEKLVEASRTQISERFATMKSDLAPHLNEQQIRTLEERQMLARQRFRLQQQ